VSQQLPGLRTSEDPLQGHGRDTMAQGPGVLVSSLQELGSVSALQADVTEKV
jgi:hypothetical protein